MKADHLSPRPFKQYRVYAEQDIALIKSLNTRWDKAFPSEQDLKNRATAKFGEFDDHPIVVPARVISVWDNLFNSVELEDFTAEAKRLEERRTELSKWQAWCDRIDNEYRE
jgi:hypothetical protein